MRILVSNFLLALLILAISIFSRRPVSSDRKESANENIEYAEGPLMETPSDVKAELGNNTHDAKWQDFRNEAEELTQQNELRILELKFQMKKPGTAWDTTYAKKIEILAQKNVGLKTILAAHGVNPNTWKPFQRTFQHDMEELDNELKNLARH